MPEIANGQLFIGQPAIVFYGNRHVPNSGAYDQDAECYRSDLTVTSVLKDSTNVAVSASTVSLTLKAFHEPWRLGIYEGTQSGTITLVENARYYLEITASQGGTTLDFVRISYTARYDSGTGA